VINFIQTADGSNCSNCLLLAKNVLTFLEGPAGAETMCILMVYVFIVVISELIVVAIGLALDRTYPLLGLPVSLSLFFAVIWFGWILAVRWTEPKRAKSVKLAS
jgi:hypothetical protein